MKNLTMKIAAAAMLAGGLLAPVRAEIAIGTSLEGYMPSANSRGALARAAQLERLSAAADALAAGNERGEGEAMLASLYSGAAAEKAAAEAVEAAPLRAETAPVRAARPAPVAPAVPAVRRSAAPRKSPALKSAIGELEDAAGGEVAADGAADSGPAAADEAPAAAADDAGASEDEEKPTLGGMFLASVIAFAVVMFFILLLI